MSVGYLCVLICLLLLPVKTLVFNNISCGWLRQTTRFQLQMGRAANVRAHTKARTDAAKAKNNGRFAKRIITVVKSGGPDPVVNGQLAVLIAEAKIANVPKDVITRNIEKASSASTLDFKESTFEFYGHGGIGLLVYVLTDNDNRAASEVYLVAKHHLLKPAAANSVKFKFNRKVRFDIPVKITEDTLMEMCLESNVDDYELKTEADGCSMSPVEEGHCSIFVNMGDLVAMRQALAAKGITAQSRLVSVPMDQFVTLDSASFDANMAAIDAFDALDDVDVVEHNIDMKGE